MNTLGKGSSVANPHTPLTSGIDGSTTQNDEEFHSSDDEYATISVTDELRRLSVERGNTRFFGKSSGVVLIQTAMDMKKEFTATSQAEPGSEPPVGLGLLNARRPEFWHFEPVRDFTLRTRRLFIIHLVDHTEIRGPGTELPISSPGFADFLGGLVLC